MPYTNIFLIVYDRNVQMESGSLTQAFRSNNPPRRHFAKHLAGISVLSVRGPIDERFGRTQLTELSPSVHPAIPRQDNPSPDSAKRRCRSRAGEAPLEAMRRRVADITLASRFQRSSPTPTDTLDEDGLGKAVNPIGLIASGFHRSDDTCIFPFLVPLNSLPSHRHARWPQGRSNFLCRAEASLCMVRHLVRHRPAKSKGNHLRNFRLRILAQVRAQARTDHPFGSSREAEQ
jgi:hypothetical protein